VEIIGRAVVPVTVVPVADAIRVELEAMAYRDGLKNK
jgi:hypothetical protein